jgi:crotonobetainyl-CoA:carnitine CoA-transferase CaiB-like acyl-CoA transferase
MHAGESQDSPDIFADPHFAVRHSFTTVEDPDLGSMRLVNVVPRVSETPGGVRSTGPALGVHNAEVYGALGLESAELEALQREGVI